MPEKLLPTTIRARVHEDAITRVSRFFDATTVETLHELFQNARRAGATRVEVAIADGEVRVRDDGQGIDDPAALLAFGQTGWDTETARREDPAGMGVYSLARRPNVTIRSRPRPQAGTDVPAWQVRLQPEHFLGEHPAAIEIIEDNDLAFGTEIVFDDEKANDGHVNMTAWYFPLPVTCNGAEVQRIDFLQSAVHIEEWRGIRLGVHKSRYHCGRNPEINFHGIVIEDVHLPKTSCMTHEWYVQADVIDCAELELVLPARKAVVETPFVEELRAACRKATYRAMLASDPGIKVSATVHEEALRHGVKLPIARARLAPWRPAAANDHYTQPEQLDRAPLPDDAIVIEAGLATCDQQALWRAAQSAGVSHRLCAEENRYRGYPWYDRLARATTMTTTVIIDGEERELEAERKRLKTLSSGRPDAITFTLETTEGDGAAGRVAIPGDVAFPNDDVGWVGDADVLVTADSEIAPDDLSELLYNAFFNPSDDAEADSYDTQRDECRQAAFAEALKLLASAEEAMISNVLTAMRRWVVPHLPRERDTTIRIRAGRPIDIQIEKPTTANGAR